jgi:chitin disaccharide deacetylase
MAGTLLINADDFGMSQQVNRAILQAFELGLCSSTSLAATLPGFEEACELAREHTLLDRVGIHLVLRDGFPLTEPIKRQPRFCDTEGRLALASTDRPILVLSRPERDALAEEIRAQIGRCRSHGIPLTHLDSHYHLHNHLAVLNVLLPIARSEGIRYLRAARNCGNNLSFTKTWYKRAVNFRLSAAGLRRTKLFGSIDDFLLATRALARPPRGSFEIMVHPVLGERGLLTDSAGGPPLEARVNEVVSRHDATRFHDQRFRPGIQDPASGEATSASRLTGTKLQPGRER